MTAADLSKRGAPQTDLGVEGEVQAYQDDATQASNAELVNAMSVDVEEYFQVSAFENIIDRASWSKIPSRVTESVENILSLLDKHNAKATFFVLGWISKKHPDLVKKIAASGHEIACHSSEHRRVSDMSRAEFRRDIVVTKKRLEDCCGAPVLGYRAPSFSIGSDTPWAHEELAEAGYSYSSSIFPISHDHYGMPEAPRFAFQPESAGILEIPMSTVRAFGRNFPCSGGGYFRLLPLAYSKFMIRHLNQRDKQSAMFYFHPWEIDPAQPRVRGCSAKSRFRHYTNLSRFESKFESVLRDFVWDRVDRVFLESR